MLQKEHRLTNSRDFRKVFAGGRTVVHRMIILKVLPRPTDQPCRFGFSTSSKLGGAVVRNRAKRLLREAVRLLGGNVRQSGYDSVMIARPPIREASFPEVSRAVTETLTKAGLLDAVVLPKRNDASK